MFEGLSVWNDESFRRLQGTYPVISISFANIKEKDFYTARKKICQLSFFRRLFNASFIQEYELALTNFEVGLMFHKMIWNWFGCPSFDYNDFIKVLLGGDVDVLNEYMNRVALQTFSSLDTGRNPSLRQSRSGSITALCWG